MPTDHEPAAEPEQDPRILRAAERLVAAAEGLPVDPTPVLTDARFRALYAALRDAGVLADDDLVTAEVVAIEETIEQLDTLRDALEAEARRRSLLAPLDNGHPGLNGHGHRHG